MESRALNIKQFRIMILMLIILLFNRIHGLCLGIESTACLVNMEEEEAMEKLNYVLSKYEEVEMKIIGEPIGVHGKRILQGDTEELNIVFQLMDNTPHDVIQTCTFVLIKQAENCESVQTVCNTFLPITPRPLLEREDLLVCPDGVQQVAAEDGDNEQLDEVEVEVEDLGRFDQIDNASV